MRLDWNVILASILLLAGAPPLMAQSGSFSEEFENGTGSWSISGGAAGVTWAADGTPSTVAGGAAYAGSSSLNYNNGTDYEGTSLGIAASPVITVASSGSPTLTFYCNFETESDDATYGYDNRQITITPGTGTPIIDLLGVTNAGTTVGPCQGMGTWHQHSIQLDPSWGTVQVEFTFDTVDSLLNNYAGWFIDSFSVSGSSTTGGGGSTGGGKPEIVQEWDFDSGIGSWIVQSSDVSVTWGANANPGTVSGGTNFVSGPNSLNYNNGTDYDAAGLASNGTATSPKIDLSGLVAPQITFSCNFETENLTTYDLRYFQISSDGFTNTAYVNAQLLSTGANPVIGDCTTMGTWHTHTVTLDPSWGSVEIRFLFDSVDGTMNNYAGWFVDDVQLLATNGGGSQNGPGWDNGREGENGDNTINDTLCGGSLSGTSGGFLSLLLTLAGLLLVILPRQLRI